MCPDEYVHVCMCVRETQKPGWNLDTSKCDERTNQCSKAEHGGRGRERQAPGQAPLLLREIRHRADATKEEHSAQNKSVQVIELLE